MREAVDYYKGQIHAEVDFKYFNHVWHPLLT